MYGMYNYGPDEDEVPDEELFSTDPMTMAPMPQEPTVGDVLTCPSCGQPILTTVNGTHACVSPSEPLRAQGWVCPVCGKGNAPFVAQCPCQGRGTVSTTTTSPTIAPQPGYTSTPTVSPPHPSITVCTNDDHLGYAGWVPPSQRAAYARHHYNGDVGP